MENFRRKGNMVNKETNSSNFGIKFRILLGYHNLTLRDISEATGAAVSTVSTWKNGRIPSSEKTLEKIAELFHVTKEYLLNGNHLDLFANRPMDELNEISMEMIGHDKTKENLRNKIEAYLARYLDKAELIQNGLEHTWIEIMKHFPLNFFDEIASNESNFLDKIDKNEKF
ncbi:MAG: helix-turn-helix domain-containing protein [Puniceicoccales bacterium]|jgi:transcriptional regulator with XRE-family HTH domain|nr:helix-turn-helix domain-containing protein [Puniceicoccales bacterium]